MHATYILHIECIPRPVECQWSSPCKCVAMWGTNLVTHFACLFSGTPCGSGKVILSPGGLTCHVAKATAKEAGPFCIRASSLALTSRRSRSRRTYVAGRILWIIQNDHNKLLQPFTAAGRVEVVGDWGAKWLPLSAAIFFR